MNSGEIKPASKVKTIAEQDAIIGFKGMTQREDGTFVCRDQEYKIGETYVLCQEPKTCSVGFHYCRTLEQTFTHYSPTKKNNVYFLVKGWGKVDEDVDSQHKIACTHMQVIRQVDFKDVLITRLIPQMQKVDKIVEDNPNAIISGSLALILLGLMPYREMKDVDITLPYFGGFNKSVVNNRFGESGEETIQMILEGYTFDLFINPQTPFTMIEFLGKTYKVADFKPIIEAKFKYLLKGTEKHAEDLIHVMTELKKRAEDDNMKSVVKLPEARDNKIKYELKTDLRVPAVKLPEAVKNTTIDDWFL